MIDVQTVIDRVTALARKRGISINQVLRESHLNKSVLDNMKRGSMPSADKLAALDKEEYAGVMAEAEVLR